MRLTYSHREKCMNRHSRGLCSEHFLCCSSLFLFTENINTVYAQVNRFYILPKNVPIFLNWVHQVSVAARRIFVAFHEIFRCSAHGLSSCGAWAQELWRWGLVAPKYVGS